MFSIFGKDDKSKERKEGGSLLDRLKQSVSKTRTQIAAKVEDLISGEKKIDPGLLTRLENALLAADIGPRTTHQILEAVRQRLERHALNNAADLKAELKNQLFHALRTLPSSKEAETAAQTARPHVIFVVGVNGTGKTTTIGKLAHRLRQSGKTVVLAAGDTFRAAAIEQLAVWATRTGSEIVKTKSGGDPAAVVFDALSSARARNADVVIVDTAGRLHTKSNLMAELDKMKRTAAKVDSRRAARSPAGDGRDYRAERPVAGPRIYGHGRSDRNRSHETRRHGQGRHRRGHHARTRLARALRRHRRSRWKTWSRSTRKRLFLPCSIDASYEHNRIFEHRLHNRRGRRLHGPRIAIGCAGRGPRQPQSDWSARSWCATEK